MPSDLLSLGAEQPPVSLEQSGTVRSTNLSKEIWARNAQISGPNLSCLSIPLIWPGYIPSWTKFLPTGQHVTRWKQVIFGFFSVLQWLAGGRAQVTQSHLIVEKEWASLLKIYCKLHHFDSKSVEFLNKASRLLPAALQQVIPTWKHPVFVLASQTRQGCARVLPQDLGLGHQPDVAVKSDSKP